MAAARVFLARHLLLGFGLADFLIRSGDMYFARHHHIALLIHTLAIKHHVAVAVVFGGDGASGGQRVANTHTMFELQCLADELGAGAG